MLAMILGRWQFVAGASALLTFLLCLALHKIDVAWLEARQAHAIDQAVKAVSTQCEKDKAITSEVSHDYQNQVAALGDRVAALKRLRRTCVPVAASAAPGRHATGKTGEPARPNGVDAETLYDFAAEAEAYRLRLTACQSFITKTWQAHAPPK